MSTLPDKYEHKSVEHKWQQFWDERKTYAWDQAESRQNSYVIDTPPPTVSGLLHMGHVFSYTQADIVARYQRMKGKNVFYPIGFDDNGLPTERLVEKTKNVKAVDMPREQFITLCQEVVQEAEEAFRALFKSVALSVDWAQEYQTISARSRKISQMSFIDLYRKDRAFRQLQPTLWDPADRTALAQADVEDKEQASVMNDIVFKTETGDALIIATTRPELLAACVCVFYHPDDARYQHLQGTYAITPLFGIKVPILADEHVSIEKGTGLVMCCTFGDLQDIDWWKSHRLETRVILDKTGRLSHMEHTYNGKSPSVNPAADVQAICERLTGLTSKKAREETLEMMKEKGLLLKQVPIQNVVKCAERSGAPLEILVTPQWFIKILDQKAEFLKKAAAINWHPAYMKVRMDQWIEGLNWDWCISRQRFFGVPFPVWYSKRAGEEGKVLLADIDQLPVDPLVDLPKGYSRDEVNAEQDVMDTWATSSVSPQLSSWGISDVLAIDSDRHQKLFPADLRPQAHEIIRTWAFYTLVKAHYHQDTIPWDNIMISGWCLAADKTKMSKSKGNVVTPVDLIEEKGADVVRYWASTSRLGADTAYSEDVLKNGKRLTNKLWNATKFAAIHLSKCQTPPSTPKQDEQQGCITEVVDRWILSRLHAVVKKATEEFERNEYCIARTAIEEFFWKDFCDNYLEFVKARAYAEQEGITSQMQQSAVITIYHCLETLLRLFAPVLPHMTEELYSHIFADRYQALGSIHARGTWPKSDDYFTDESALIVGQATVEVLDTVRRYKAEHNVSPKRGLKTLAIHDQPQHLGKTKLVQLALFDLKHVCNAQEVLFNDGNSHHGLVSEQGLFTVVTELLADEA
ncbi:MAG: valine--tRNA ligase [Alphaproteobacteria bacterium]|nr:valine--tRNA ligase [Alphaproteobacteria bacterium]